MEALGEITDVWMPDYKYHCSPPAAKYSHAPNYPETARKAIDMMHSLQPRCEFDSEGIMTRGLLIRHLLLPGGLEDSRAAIGYLYGRYGENAWYSIMSQYTPPAEAPFPELGRRVTSREYDALVDYALGLGMENAFIQEGGAAEESFIPQFDCEGVFPERD